MIKLQIIGFCGKDAEINTVSGKQVVNFSVAHSEKWKDAQGKEQSKSIWADCAYWTDRVKVADYLKKGTQVYVEGQPDVRTWESNGKHGASLIMRVQSVQLLGSSGNGNSNKTADINAATYRGSNNNVATSSPADITEPLDDLPF